MAPDYRGIFIKENLEVLSSVTRVENDFTIALVARELITESECEDLVSVFSYSIVEHINLSGFRYFF